MGTVRNEIQVKKSNEFFPNNISLKSYLIFNLTPFTLEKKRKKWMKSSTISFRNMKFTNIWMKFMYF